MREGDDGSSYEFLLSLILKCSLFVVCVRCACMQIFFQNCIKECYFLLLHVFVRVTYIIFSYDMQRDAKFKRYMW